MDFGASKPAGTSPGQPGAGVFLSRNFLAPLAMARVLGALDRLSSSWTPSTSLRLLGRGRTSQIRSSDISAQSPLDDIRNALAPSVLEWARRCGLPLPASPRLQLFPVRMVGDADSPAYQEPHVDSNGSEPGPPICTNVFYAVADTTVGGELAVAARSGADLVDPILISPSPNLLASFPGDRVHAVRPLYAGKRLSVVINFY